MNELSRISPWKQFGQLIKQLFLAQALGSDFSSHSNKSD